MTGLRELMKRELGRTMKEFWEIPVMIPSPPEGANSERRLSASAAALRVPGR